MNIILYGIPADTAELIAGRYDLELIHSIEEIGTCGALLPVPKITAPRQLLALYNALMRHEDAIDAVIICGSETCGAAGTICYGAPPGKIFTLCGDPGGEELEAELFRLLDAIFTQDPRSRVAAETLTNTGLRGAKEATSGAIVTECWGK